MFLMLSSFYGRRLFLFYKETWRRHKDVSERLKKINPVLAVEVRKILDENKAERHIRGGMATKLKYSNLKKH